MGRKHFIEIMVYRIENLDKNDSRNCYICSGKSIGTWRLVGYDEYGELWICQPCWNKLPSHEDPAFDTKSEKQDID